MEPASKTGNQNAASRQQMNHLNTVILKPDPQGLEQAAALLKQGQLVAFATETVYGLGADACNSDAVAAIYEAKGRPSFNPLIVHFADQDRAKDHVVWNEIAQTLADRFWPGPLTMVLPLRAGHGLSRLVTAGLDTVALRIPAHPKAQAMLRAFGGGVAAPSANPSGRISATTAAHVYDGLNGRIAAIVDDGPCAVGLESTIIAASTAPVLLRAGGIPQEDLEQVLGQALAQPDQAEICAPGMLSSHYAPRAAMRLNAGQAHDGEVLLGFGDMACDLNLSPAGDLRQAAARLFDQLHQLDKTGRPIAVAPIPHTGLGVAINDRLARAAAPR